MRLNGKHFAKKWEKGWNSHNLDEILSHYRDDVVFHSRKAIPLLGTGEIKGINLLEKYWSLALEKQPDLNFSVQGVFEGHDMLVISYVNQCSVEAVETLYFDEHKLVYRAAACHKIDVN